MKIFISNNWIYDERWWMFKLLKHFFHGNVELTECPNNCDILLFSTFGEEDVYKTANARYKIFCSWETRFYIDISNSRMPYADLCLTYMPTEGKNVRLPLWYQWIDWWNENETDEFTLVCGQSHHYIGNNILDNSLVPSLNNLTKSYDSNEILNRPYFCAMLVGNPEKESLSIRSQIYNDINANVGKIHGFGNAFNNRFEGNKIDLLRNFKFNICYENSIHKGYVTEKLFDAKFAGCVPIYYGDDEYSRIDFNKNCFINRLNFGSNYDFVKEIKKLHDDGEYFKTMCEEPLFLTHQIPSLDYIYETLENFFK